MGWGLFGQDKGLSRLDRPLQEVASPICAPTQTFPPSIGKAAEPFQSKPRKAIKASTAGGNEEEDDENGEDEDEDEDEDDGEAHKEDAEEDEEVDDVEDDPDNDAEEKEEAEDEE